MKSLRLLLLIFLAYKKCQGNQDYEITHPERLHPDRAKRDFSTATENGHEKTATFAVNAFQKKWILDAKHNDQLIQKSFLIRTFDSNDNEVITREAPESCYYQGSVRGIPDSVVVLHTCNGLRGLIDDGMHSYLIEPQDDFKISGAHKITKDETDQFDPSEHCGTQSDEHPSDSLMAGKSRLATSLEILRRGLGLVVNAEDIYKSYLTTNETRYAETVFVMDHVLYSEVKDVKAASEMILLLCNAVDAIYQRINIRIIPIAIELWTNGERMQRPEGASGGLELREFSIYRKTHISPKIPNDNAQFLSYRGWGNAIGMATVGAMCSPEKSTGIDKFHTENPLKATVTLAHEMGHNFGFSHNTPPCKCLTPKGCFMYGGGMDRTNLPGFSDCNLLSLKKKTHTCLFNVPTKNLNARCGNGIKEEDEECDCGTPEMCKLKDPCCLPYDCRLKPSSQCSDLHHTCCQDCQFKKQGALCREIKSDCDVPEYCPGNSGDCPGDAVMRDGTPCDRNNKLLLGNTDKNNIVVNPLSPRIQARYVRINPQYWNSLICMRTELLGCSADEGVNPTMPTSLKTFDYKFCIVPQKETCDATANNYIKYKAGFECKESFMEFRLDASGILWHECSNRKVCPASAKNKDGVKLMISDDCQDEDSKFVRTSMHSLKHVKTGRCVHPKGKSPKNNALLVLKSQCDEKRLKISFVKPDCMIPLGISSKAIPDSHMKASSSKGGFLPSEGRLFGSLRWCARETNKNQYLQIDLGKTQTISHVITQGHGGFNAWVTGYHLLYSGDGNQWTGYTESGDALHSNTYCFAGNCAETRATQCRDLWGAEANDAAKSCYSMLNTEGKNYGTCDPLSNTPCGLGDVLCGQIQCNSPNDRPKVDYGKHYKTITAGDAKCSAAALKNSDTPDQGMVEDGTKCGEGKMCKDNQCKPFAKLNIKICPVVDGAECSGQGVCTSSGICHCYGLYDPKTACKQALLPQDGGFSDWSAWSKCTAGCNGGKQTRHRFCTNPLPMYGGKDCKGKLQQERDCNTKACPKARSCRHLQFIASKKNIHLPDGVYDIYPEGFTAQPIKTYCDMSRDGGGWTLLVTSATNTWTENDVTLRNADKPSLIHEYSILKYADDIKDNPKVQGSTIEYRLEADRPGRWGGIWEAPRSYTFTTRDNKQTDVRLLKKFDNWEYDSKNGIDKRMPWISGAFLTTSKEIIKGFGSITANLEDYYPAPWIKDLMDTPQFIWYWVREGPSDLHQYY